MEQNAENTSEVYTFKELATNNGLQNHANLKEIGAEENDKECTKLEFSEELTFTVLEVHSSFNSNVEILELPSDTVADKSTGKVFPCDTCNKKFSIPVGLKRHKLFCNGKQGSSKNDELDIDVHTKEASKRKKKKRKVEENSHIKKKKKFFKKAIKLLKDSQIVPPESKDGVEFCACCGVDIKIAHKINLQCPKCNKKYKLQYKLNEHMTLYHSENKTAIPCNDCNYVCRNKNIYKQHLQEHKKRKFLCPNESCGKSFTRKFDLERHLKNTGCDGREIERYQCEVCKVKLTRYDNMLDHIRGHLNVKDKNKFKCSICNKNFTREIELQCHHTKIHTGKKNKYQCDICKRWYFSKQYLSQHIQLHNGNRPFRCDQCGFYFRTLPVLKRHMLRHTSDKPFQCEHCNSSFIQRKQMEYHIYWHTGYSPYKCKYCHKMFPINTRLQRHIQYVHEGKEKIKCLIPNCERKFADKQAFKAHMKNHNATNSKLFSCSVCKKEFMYENALVIHSRVHNFEVVRRCPFCDLCERGARAYVRADLLIRHIRVKHQDEYHKTLLELRGSQLTYTGRVPRTTNLEQIQFIDVIDQLIAEKEAMLLKPKDEQFGLTDVQPGDDGIIESIKLLLQRFIDKSLLETLGWGRRPIDRILEDVIKSCDLLPVSRELERDVRLRENTKCMLRYAVEDKNLIAMLDTDDFDETIKHILDATSDFTDA